MNITLTHDITVRLVQEMGGDHMVVASARVSTSGEAALAFCEEPTEANYGLIRYLMQHRHGTPFEHSALTFFVHAPQFVWWEWVRHRVGMSYNLESSRYKKLEPVFWVPRRERRMAPTSDHKPARPSFQEVSAEQYDGLITEFEKTFLQAWDSYEMLLHEGIASEVARAVLPSAVYFSGWVTCNPRSLMHFLSLRTHEPEAAYVSYPQAEIEEAARSCEEVFAQGWPLTYKAFLEGGRVAP